MLDQSQLFGERLESLKEDFSKGTAELRAMDEARARLRDQLLRIDGAITALSALARDDASRSVAPAHGNGQTDHSRRPRSRQRAARKPESVPIA